jgi:homoserine dehydrogenase
MESIKVALLGFGTIGSGVARLLLEEPDRLARHSRRRVELAYVVDKDLTRPRNVSLPKGLLSDNLDRALDDPAVKVVIELIGGTGVARSVVLRALESGKDVVTANKALLATHGAELFECARRSGRTIAFEAAVAGGIPVIAAIGQSLSANRIESVRGILNGTCNFILTQMERLGLEYANVLAEAQRLGYAEADPTMDVDGSDTTQKLAILAQLAFGAAVDWKSISRTGIDALGRADIRCAERLGYAIRLVASGQLGPDGLELCVAPTLVAKGAPLAGVEGAFNAVEVVGDAVGPVFFRGLGAGQNPTASAVVADLIDTVAGRTAITFAAQNLWSREAGRAVAIRDAKELVGRFYLRAAVRKGKDVVGQIIDLLQQSKIPGPGKDWSDAVAQHDDPENAGLAHVVVTTGAATEGTVAAVVEAIQKMPFVAGPIVRCRVAD